MSRAGIVIAGLDIFFKVRLVKVHVISYDVNLTKLPHVGPGSKRNPKNM